MIGPKKLSAIRQELQRAVTATGDDPIRWLERRMTASAFGERQVLESLRRILDNLKKDKRRKRRSGAKK
jgi:LmbE family N-acetylglucosaminyl deacetylase